MSLTSLPEGYRAVVFGASGGLGSALLAALESDPRCGTAIGLHRRSDPPLELTDEATIEAAAQHVADTHGGIECLLDATGVLTIDGAPPEKTIARLDPARMQQAFAINATGPALLLKHFAPLLPRRGRGLFATLSARVGSIGDNRRGGWISYRASKAALNQIVRTAAIELAFRHPEAVVVGLQPGTVDTPLSRPYARGEGVLAPAESAARLLAVLDRLDPGRSGELVDHAGATVPP
ncbi:MAG: SDR family NAD(P)-dependent oxidoreductase [Halofilum sp. (in: g-proteobacteria)]|nr:SDR family NAD(P)-dependent oxidoreductase [Halofilum sp. (in: g-proteobacteria)]